MVDAEPPAKRRCVDPSPPGSHAQAILELTKKFQEEVATLVQAYNEREVENSKDPLLAKLREVLECGSDAAGELKEVIRFNVGGDVRFAIRRSTLTCIPQSCLGRIFRHGWDKYLPRDEAGRIFLDLDPAQLGAIMKWCSEVERLQPQDKVPAEPFGRSQTQDPKLKWLSKQLCMDMGLPTPWYNSFEGLKVCELHGIYHSDTVFIHHKVYCRDSRIVTSAGLQLRLGFEADRGSGPKALKVLHRMSQDGADPEVLQEKFCRANAIMVVQCESGPIFSVFQNMEELDAFPPGGGVWVELNCLDPSRETDQTSGCLQWANTAPAAEVGDALVFVAGERPRLMGRLLLDFADASSFSVQECEIFEVVGAATCLGHIGDLAAAMREKEGMLKEVVPEQAASVDSAQRIFQELAAWERSLNATPLTEQSLSHEVKFLKHLTGHRTASRKADIVSLNVRGTSMATFRATLQQAPGSMLATMFGDRWSIQPQSLVDGDVELDLDPEHFVLILRALRLRSREGRDSQREGQLPPIASDQRPAFYEQVSFLALQEMFALPSIDSKIIHKMQTEGQLRKMLPEQCSSPWKLLFRVESPSFPWTLGEDFHKSCDDKGPTVVLAKSKRTGRVYGGFSDVFWDSSGTFKPSFKSFVFVLTQTLSMFKIKDTERSRAIHCNPSMGPCFGVEDLHFDGSRQAVVLQKKLGGTYLSQEPAAQAVEELEVEVLEVFAV